MKVTLEFDTDSENFSQDELDRVLKADDMCHCLYYLSLQIRGWCNHPERYGKLTEDSLSEFFYNTLNEHDINLERLYP